MKAERVLGERSDSRSPASAVKAATRVAVGEAAAPLVAPAVDRFRARPRRVLPLGFARQPKGFTHNVAAGDIDGDGDMDILVANHGGEFMGGGPYFLVNDGAANFTASGASLPGRVANDAGYWTWAAEIADLDGDGHQDLLMGGAGGDAATGEPFIYWGAEDGEFHDRNLTVLAAPEFFFGVEGGHFPISTATGDLNGDGRMDVILGSYNGAPDFDRAIQLLINAGDREFNDETD